MSLLSYITFWAKSAKHLNTLVTNVNLLLSITTLGLYIAFMLAQQHIGCETVDNPDGWPAQLFQANNSLARAKELSITMIATTAVMNLLFFTYGATKAIKKYCCDEFNAQKIIPNTRTWLSLLLDLSALAILVLLYKVLGPQFEAINEQTQTQSACLEAMDKTGDHFIASTTSGVFAMCMFVAHLYQHYADFVESEEESTRRAIEDFNRNNNRLEFMPQQQQNNNEQNSMFNNLCNWFRGCLGSDRGNEDNRPIYEELPMYIQ